VETGETRNIAGDAPGAGRTCRISKSFKFEAAHRLLMVPPGHQCGRLHGHSYRFVIEAEGPVDARSGFVVDFAVLGEFGKLVEQTLDHQCLNDVFENRFETTAENLAWWILDSARKYRGVQDVVTAVRVSETASTWAEARLR
jgi:6-pyruvoyltetrahydropterin/6-carboxytetrahydropterin synthase